MSRLFSANLTFGKQYGYIDANRIIYVGVINREAQTNVYIGPGAQPKEELLLGQAKPRRKGTVSHLKVTHRTTPRKRINIKKEKGQGEAWKYLRKSYCQCIKYSATN